MVSSNGERKRKHSADDTSSSRSKTLKVEAYESEDGEVSGPDSRKERKRSKDRRKKEKKDREKQEDRDRERERKDRDKERRDREKEKDRDREKEKDRDRDREKERKEKRDRDRDRDRRDRDRDRDRQDRERSSKKTEPAPVVQKKTPQEIAAEKAAEQAYKARVEAQLHQMQDDDEEDEEKLARERRERRAKLLAKFSKSKPKEEEEQEKKKEEEEEEKKEPEVVTKQPEPESEPAPAQTYSMFSDDVNALPEVDTGKIAGAEEGEDTDRRDHEGYYRFRLGDVLNGRYRVVGNQGKGVFSTVLRVRDQGYGNRELVIKVIRHNDVMRKAGEMELDFLNRIAQKDPENKKNCVRLLSHFEHADHLCMVFEPMHMNLREVVKKLGGTGLNIRAVRTFAKQMFTALKHLKKLRILHADIKPDNILVNEAMNMTKLCDLGSAGAIADESKCEITPYLVSRFYRPPEIMLGLPYNEACDMWSMGCVLYELYTGKILFPGKDNNHMLQLIQKLKGAFTAKKIKKGQFLNEHFDSEFKFRNKTIDPLTKKELTTCIRIVKPEKSLLSMLKTFTPSNEREKAKIPQFADLLEKIFILDVDRRLSVEDALKHPFVADE